MSERPIVVCDEYGEPLVPTIPEEVDDEEIEIAENADDYELVIRRHDDVEQLTADYIIALMGLEDAGFDAIEIGLDPATLTAIVEDIEDLLTEYGIEVYHPVMVRDKEGYEFLVHNLTEAADYTIVE